MLQFKSKAENEKTNGLKRQMVKSEVWEQLQKKLSIMSSTKTDHPKLNKL